MTDVIKPSDDPFSLIGHSWPRESESAYRTAEMMADEAATSAQAQSQSATDSARKTSEGMQGQTSDSVSGKYVSIAAQLDSQGQHYRTISGWMLDASGEVSKAKNRIAALVRAGTSEIREALDSELSGTPVTPSSTELTDRYRADISSVSMKLATELDSIGHSLSGDAGASTTPAYVRTEPTAAAPTIQQAAHQEASGQTPAVELHQLPPMPRASTPTPESPSTPSAPSSSTSPHVVNPTLANLVGSGGQSTGTSSSPSAKPASTPSGTPASAPAGQAHQSPEQHQQIRPTGLPRIPSVALPDLPAAAADIATTVTSATGSQLATTAPSALGSSIPVSTGTTPGTSGPAPMPPAGLAPIGGLTTPPVMQAPPVTQVSPATPSPTAPAPSPAQSPPPAAPRGPVVDAAWIQRNYGLSPCLDLPKAETSVIPALFITELPEPEATLHRALATLRHQFEAAGWSQPMAVATIKRDLESRTVYVTADGLSIHPSGVLLPHGVTPLDEIPGTPATSELSGSLMVSEKLTALIPREWTVEHVLSTVPAEENSQTIEQYQTLVGAEELLPCKLARGRDDVDVDEAMAVFARAALGSRGCGELDVESARIRAGRWVGTQPTGYLDALARWYLSDAAEAMSRGSWGEAVYSAEKYMSIRSAENKAA